MSTNKIVGQFINRRGFLLGSASAALAGCVSSGTAAAKAGARVLKPGEKYRIGFIGCGVHARNDLMWSFTDTKLTVGAKVVAVCDCDSERRAFAAEWVDSRYKDAKGTCKAVADFRDIVNDPSIDAVVIATPDHWHAYMCVEAMKHGKDVYCEKPTTYSVEEAIKVMEAERKYGRVFQNGSMQRSWDVFYTACMAVRNGFIGNVRYVDAQYGWGSRKSKRSGEPIGMGGPSQPARFFDEAKLAAEEGAPNPNVDWNMWLGPARWRPYSDQLAPRGLHKFYPMFWRFDDEFGTGYCGDWGAHYLDIAQWGLDMDKSGPYKVICSEEPHSLDLQHGGRRQFGMKMLFREPWGDVEMQHLKAGVWGVVFYGDDGVLAVARGKIAMWTKTGPVKPTPENRKAIADGTFMPEKCVAKSIGKDYGTDSTVKKDDILAAEVAKIKKYCNFDACKVQLYKSPNQIKNFCECIASRKETVSPAEVGCRGAILCHLCNASYVYDTGFDWDPVRNEIPGGNPKGISLRRQAYRNGWDIVV